MSVQIVKKFLSEEYCKELTAKIDPLLVESPRRLYYSEIWGSQYPPKSFEDQDFEADYFANLSNSGRRGLSMLLNAFHLTKREVEKHYGVDITLFEGGLMRMEENAVNKIHADRFKLNSFVNGRDGDGDGDLCQFSAILYLSEHDKDFVGGYIDFPQHDLHIPPEYGMLLFFPGDEEHVHEVTKVLGGNRYGITMFMGYEDV